MRVITELFNRGDIVRADALKPPSKEGATRSTLSIGSIRSTLTSYLWGAGKQKPPSLDEDIVPIAALKAAAARASSMSGPTASADIHTVKSFAQAITASSTRDAEAVIAHLVAQGEAVTLFTDVTKENPVPIFGVKISKGRAGAADKGVLHTKAALERMEDMSSHLTSAVESEKTAATDAAKSGNKSEALARLRKKKALENKLTSARAAAAKLSDVLMAVDEADSNREAVTALETGMKSLRLAQEDGVTAGRVDAVAADFDEMMAEQQDLRVAFEQLNVGTTADDHELESELDELMENEKKAGKAEEVETTTKPDAKPAWSNVDQELEDELETLLAELPMPSDPHGKTTGVAGTSSDTGAGEANQEKPVETGPSAA